jgi:hypothetical protein
LLVFQLQLPHITGLLHEISLSAFGRPLPLALIHLVDERTFVERVTTSGLFPLRATAPPVRLPELNLTGLAPGLYGHSLLPQVVKPGMGPTGVFVVLRIVIYGFARPVQAVPQISGAIFLGKLPLRTSIHNGLGRKETRRVHSLLKIRPRRLLFFVKIVVLFRYKIQLGFFARPVYEPMRALGAGRRVFVLPTARPFLQLDADCLKVSSVDFTSLVVNSVTLTACVGVVERDAAVAIR